MSLSIYFSTQRTHSRLTRSCLRCTHSPHHASPRPTRAWKPFAMREPCTHATPYPCEPRTLPRPRPIPLARELEECPSLYIFPHSAHTPASHALAYGAHTLHTTPLPVLRVHGSHLLCVRALRKADEYRIACAQPRAIIGSRASVSSHTTRIACAHTPTHRMALYPPRPHPSHTLSTLVLF